jgi:hypothetical protein
MSIVGIGLGWMMHCFSIPPKSVLLGFGGLGLSLFRLIRQGVAPGDQGV